MNEWSFLLPLAVVLAFVLGRAPILLWSAGGEQRRKVWSSAIVFLILGSIAPQEFPARRSPPCRCSPAPWPSSS